MKRSLKTAVLIFFILFVLLFTRILGALAAPVLERTLSRLFGMPVSVERLSVNPFTGHIHAEGLEFRNQAGFSYGPHMYVGVLDVTMDFMALKDKRVSIEAAVFNHLYYLIERREFGGEKTTNVKTWYRHIKALKHKKQEPEKEEDEGTSWTVSINNIVIQNGSFVYDDRTQGEVENRFVFHKLKGKMTGFRYPAKPQTHLEQHVELAGVIGDSGPAPVEVAGDANFSGGDVSFDLTGKIREGYMEPYSRFWRELPITVKKGRFNLDLRMLCVREQVRSHAMLHLYNLRILPGPGVTEKLWGIPVSSALGFLQRNREMRLRVPVSGNIEDPQFDFYRAFERAFQEAFREKLIGGVTMVASAPVKLAVETKDMVVQTQETLTSGIGKIASIVTSAGNQK